MGVNQSPRAQGDVIPSTPEALGFLSYNCGQREQRRKRMEADHQETLLQIERLIVSGDLKMALDQAIEFISELCTLLQTPSLAPERTQETLACLSQTAQKAQTLHLTLFHPLPGSQETPKGRGPPPVVPNKPKSIRSNPGIASGIGSLIINDVGPDSVKQSVKMVAESSETFVLDDSKQSLKSPHPSFPTALLPKGPVASPMVEKGDTQVEEGRFSKLVSSKEELFTFKRPQTTFSQLSPGDAGSPPRQASVKKSTDPPTIPRSVLMGKYEALVGGTSNIDTSSPSHTHISKVSYSKRASLSNIVQLIHLAVSVTQVTHLRPFLVAFQLTLIEQSIFMNIQPNDFSTHRPPLHPEPSIVTSTMFFNYLSRTVESSILEPNHHVRRASAIESWIKIAKHLYDLRNFQTLKALVSALGTPPIARLRQTWTVVDKKRQHDLKELVELMSEKDNYSAYRKWLKLNISRPMIPYIGIYLHDTTYLLALQNKEGIKDTSLSKMVQDIVIQIKFFQSDPHYTPNFLSSPSQGGVFQTLYSKTKKTPITSLAPDELQVLNSMSEEAVAEFINHWILSQKWLTEKAIDELSLAREPKVDTRQSPISEASSATPGPPFVNLDCKPTASSESLPTDAQQKATLASITFSGGKTILESLKSTTRKVMDRTKSSDSRHKHSHSGGSGKPGQFHARNESIDSKADEETVSGSETSMALSLRSDGHLPTETKIIAK